MKKIKALLKENLKELISLLAVVVAASGIVTSFFTARMTIATTKQQNAMQNAFVEQQNALQRKVAYSNLLTTAIAHLNDPKLGVRCGATYEFKKIAIESEEDREMIVEILTKFVREGIESIPRTDDKGEVRSWYENRPGDDVFLAAEVLSFLYTEYELRCDLEKLKGEKLYLSFLDLQGARFYRVDFQETWLMYAKLQGANLYSAAFQGAQLSRAYLQNVDLSFAKLQGADLSYANLQEADLSYADFQEADIGGAKLQGANLRNAENLTVEQLLDGKYPAFIDSTTILDDALGNDPRIQARIKEVEAEQATTPNTDQQ